MLSIQTFPISFNDQWWGFVGFDDCETPREWDEGEILMLRTASEIIGHTLRRWQTEEHLRETLIHLEQRVLERTMEYAQVNAELWHEIHERQHFQKQLEERFKIESTLAEISARLLSPMELKTAVQKTMADLGEILEANRVIFIPLSNYFNTGTSDPIVWHASECAPFSDEWHRNLYNRSILA